jgi:hypothetical protein
MERNVRRVWILGLAAGLALVLLTLAIWGVHAASAEAQGAQGPSGKAGGQSQQPPQPVSRDMSSGVLPATCVELDIVPSPNGGTGYNYLASVSALTSNDVWAVGHNNTGAFSINRTMTEHWDGTAWTVVPSPNLSIQDN